MNQQTQQRPAAPGYWMHETGGALAPAILRYLENEPLTVRDLVLIRAYIRQWIHADVWDSNPNLGEDGRAELARLRRLAQGLNNRDAIDSWIAESVDFGLDPL